VLLFVPYDVIIVDVGYSRHATFGLLLNPFG
jgi:hypothetical protein